ncbi:MAG: DUF3800 domain-containing protein [Bryobacteraceae bacterium]
MNTCFGKVAVHPHRDSGFKVVFDRKEKFHAILRKVWKVWKQKDRGRPVWWAGFVSSIEEIDDMRESPEIQAADLLAWSANRYHTHGSGDRWGSLLFRTFLAKQHYHIYIDEAALLMLFESDGTMRAGVVSPPPSIDAPF